MGAADPIAGAMQSALDEGVFPGAVLLVRLRGRPAYHRAFGLAARIPDPEPASLATVYDLASLTKPLATTTALLCLVQDGRIGLDAPVQDCLPELRGAAVGGAPLARLLNHSAGLPAWRPFFERIAERDREQSGFLGGEAARRLALEMIRDEPPVSPIGARSLYSDLGFMLLGWVVERVAGQPLAAFCRRRVYDRIGADELFFVESGGGQVGGVAGRPVDLRRIAPTEEDPWRGRLLRGEVHDENAWALGGIAGHSGLFGTAGAVGAVSQCWLDAYRGRASLLSGDLVRRCVRRDEQTAGSSWALGWDTPSAPSSAGARFSAHSFGHLGFTGTSLWIDPEAELAVVLLSNRVHPTRKNEAIRTFRPLIHDVIYEAMVG